MTLDSASHAMNKDQLNSWNKKQMHYVKEYVPSAYRHYASKNVENEYNKRLSELENTTGTHTETVVAAEDSEINLAALSALTLISAKHAKTEDQLKAWKKKQLHDVKE